MNEHIDIKFLLNTVVYLIGLVAVVVIGISRDLGSAFQILGMVVLYFLYSSVLKD